MKTDASLTIGVTLLAALGLVAVFAPALATYSPAAQNLAHDLAASSADHLLGTDKLGRDVLSRVLFGSRISLAVGATTVAVSLAIGLSLGALSGFFGGRTDRLLMRLVDILMAFPGIL